MYLEKISIHQANVDQVCPSHALKFIFSAVIIRFSFDIVEGILKFGTWMVKQAGLSVNGSTADATSILLAAVQNEII